MSAAAAAAAAAARGWAPRRSALFLPGSHARALAKARTLPADVIIVDLEDAVAPAAKAAARAAAVAELARGGFGARELVLRVNGADTPWGADDLDAAAGIAAHVSAVLLPKVEAPATLAAARAALAAHSAAAARLPLWAMIETPRGVLAAQRTADAGARDHGLACLVAGTSDLAKELRARHTRDRAPLLTALSLVVLAARAAGLAALDGVHLDLADADGLEAACAQGRALGFDGKTLIHPSQLAAANAAYGPTAEDADAARRVLLAHAEAEAQGAGVAVVDGKLVEALHVHEARATLAQHAALLERGVGPGPAGGLPVVDKPRG